VGYVSTSAAKMVIIYGLLSTTSPGSSATNIGSAKLSNKSLLERACTSSNNNIKFFKFSSSSPSWPNGYNFQH